MNDALKHKIHAYYLDFLPSMSKEDGLWEVLQLHKIKNPGQKLEYEKEYSLFIQASYKIFSVSIFLKFLVLIS